MMQKPERKKNRLSGYDYASCGAYFITICTNRRQHLFWNNVGATCGRPPTSPPLSPIGEVVRDEILCLDETYEAVQLDHYCIMPNHIHLLLLIRSDADGRPQVAPTISRIIQQFKGAVTKKVGHAIWQKSFHDHIIRNREDYLTVWRYIDENPLKWHLDSLCQ